ncbi:MAG: sulfurtransferase-like selenium metabolism protein YedF [Thermodesulfovibrionia bacterium]
MILDARGLGCPKPVTMAEDELNKIEEGIVEILVDNEASVENLKRFATKCGLYSEVIKEGDYWRVRIVKGYGCVPDERVAQVTAAETGGKELLLVVSSDVIGKDEEIGRVLMKGLFETMKVTRELPHTIFFINKGVKLTTINEEVIGILKEINAMGTEIYSCGTCLKHYNLESELKVGYRGTTNHIVEGFKDFKKIVWI